MAAIITAEQIIAELKDYIKQSPIKDESLETLILSAKPNDVKKTETSKGKTEFPDFICTNGFIEHFEITSGGSNRKGYNITIQNKKNEAEHEKFRQNPTNNSCITSIDRSRSNNSIKNLHKSIVEHLTSHLDSYDNYNGNKHLSCFLMSSDDLLRPLLYTSKNCPDEKAEIRYEEFEHQNKVYNMCYDKYLLDFLYSYKDKIDYIIYYNQNKYYFEILCISEIPIIIKDLHSDADFLYSYDSQPIQSIDNIDLRII